MRVCRHRCGVKMFRFSRGYHAGTNFKKFWSSKLHKFTLFTHFLSAETWKILTKKVCQFLSAQADILSEKNPYFRKHLFGKRKLITRTTLFGQDFASGKNLFFNQCRTKSVVTMTPGWPCNKPDLTIKGTTLYSAPRHPESMVHTNIHDPCTFTVPENFR